MFRNNDLLIYGQAYMQILSGNVEQSKWKNEATAGIMKKQKFELGGK